MSERTPAQRAASKLWTLLDQPKEFKNPETFNSWSRTLSDCMGEAEMSDYDSFSEFLTWVLETHPKSAEFMRLARDPAATLKKNLPWLLKIFKAYQKGQSVRAARSKPATEKLSQMSEGDTDVKFIYDDPCIVVQPENGICIQGHVRGVKLEPSGWKRSVSYGFCECLREVKKNGPEYLQWLEERQARRLAAMKADPMDVKTVLPKIVEKPELVSD